MDTTHEAAAEWVSIDSLVPWKLNPRHNGNAIDPVANSIKRFGFSSPIIARKADREVIAGHTRLLAAKKLGLEKVPVRFLDLDPTEAHLLALADNKLGEKAEWDDTSLAQVLSSYTLDDAMLAGFETSDLKRLADEITKDLPPLSIDLVYQIVVECKDEKDQAALVSRFEADGLKCRPVIL